MPKVFPEYKIEAKNRVIKAAIKVFSKKGFHDATMDDIASELGVSRGALYLYFKSKNNILQEIFLCNQQCLRELLEKHYDDPDPLKTAARLFDEISDSKKERMPIHFEIIALASHDKEIRDILLEDAGKDDEVIQCFVEAHMEKGNIRTDVDARLLSQLITALYLRLMEKLIIGVDKAEVKQDWLASLSIIIEPKK